jgi:hypothetical protein
MCCNITLIKVWLMVLLFDPQWHAPYQTWGNKGEPLEMEKVKVCHWNGAEREEMEGNR